MYNADEISHTKKNKCGYFIIGTENNKIELVFKEQFIFFIFKIFLASTNANVRNKILMN